MVLLLAAGRAARYGRDKRRELLYKGLTLLELSVDCYRRTGLHVVTCLSAQASDDDLESMLSARGNVCIRCNDAQLGMGATLAEAVRGVAHTASALFIALGDMPVVQRETLDALEAKAHPDRIALPCFDGRRGHPVLFGASFFSQLASLGGDRGAVSLLQQYASACSVVPVEDPGVVRDVDRPADGLALAQYLRTTYDDGASG